MPRPRSAVRTAPARSLGPVANLEQHLPPDWWRTLFNAVYVMTDGDVVENPANTAADVDLLISAAQLTPSSRVLDLCCGQGRHTLELARRGFGRLTGIDRSRYLVRLARRRARAGGLSAEFREGDARSLAAQQPPFDCVALLGNSFGYFEQQDDDLAILVAVRAALRPGGVLAMDITDGDWTRQNFEPRSWEWIDRHHFACRERALSADGTRLVCREVVTHTARGVIADQFYAERLYSVTQLKVLLDRAGFVDVEEHGSILSGSDRNQDLGMMAHRLFVTARRPGPRPKSPRPPAARTPVTVLLGDPRLGDAVKRDGKFQPEDEDTVRRLKAALDELPGWRFAFHDRHDQLVDTLRREKPAFVFNLCDEGYRNEAERELHVPALLELLDIPHTGAGPSCLGFCYNKPLVAATASALGIPVPTEYFLATSDSAVPTEVPFPAIVKPACGDGSVGIPAGNVVHNPAELSAAVAQLRTALPGRAILVQEFLPGAEYTVGLVGNPAHGLHVLPILAVDYSGLDPSLPRILGYESKWLPDSPWWTDIRYVAADLSVAETRRLNDYATRLFVRSGCRDYARFDFRTDAHGTVKFLEINPNPGWCWDGKLALMAALAGWRYPELLRQILLAAHRRIGAPHPTS